MRDQGVVKFQFGAFRTGPGKVHVEPACVAGFRRQSLADARRPVAVMILAHHRKGVAAAVGRISVGGVVVERPVHELIVAIAADRIDVEKIEQAHLPCIHVETLFRYFRGHLQRPLSGIGFGAAEPERVVDDRSRDIRASVGNARQIDVGEGCKAMAAAQVAAIGLLQMKDEIGNRREADARVQRQHPRCLHFSRRGETLGAAVKRAESRVSLHNQVDLAGHPEVVRETRRVLSRRVLLRRTKTRHTDRRETDSRQSPDYPNSPLAGICRGPYVAAQKLKFTFLSASS